MLDRYYRLARQFLLAHDYTYPITIKRTYLKRHPYAGRRKFFYPKQGISEWAIYHECWHIVQIEEAGFWWRIKYLFNQEDWEVEANIKATKFLKGKE